MLKIIIMAISVILLNTTSKAAHKGGLASILVILVNTAYSSMPDEHISYSSIVVILVISNGSTRLCVEDQPVL